MAISKNRAEAKSRGKVHDARKDDVAVYSCASLTLPLLAQHALTRNQPRAQRRLQDRIPDLTAALRRATDKHKIFAGDRPGSISFAKIWDGAG